MIYLYAITTHPLGDGHFCEGLADRPVFWLSYGRVSAVVSALASAVQPTEANVWRHEAVVEALMADCAVLPVRFGTVFLDKEELGAVLAAHDGDLVRDLERVRGRVELGLRVLWDVDDDPEPPNRDSPAGAANALPTGRDYMLARLKRERQRHECHQRAEALAARIHCPLAHLATDSRKQLLVTPRLLLTSAYLVPRGHMAAFEQELETLRAAYPQLGLLCTGPWPAYSFVTTAVTADP
jgi:hypothetical protein